MRNISSNATNNLQSTAPTPYSTVSSSTISTETIDKLHSTKSNQLQNASAIALKSDSQVFDMANKNYKLSPNLKIFVTEHSTSETLSPHYNNTEQNALKSLEKTDAFKRKSNFDVLTKSHTFSKNGTMATWAHKLRGNLKENMNSTFGIGIGGSMKSNNIQEAALKRRDMNKIKLKRVERQMDNHHRSSQGT